MQQICLILIAAGIFCAMGGGDAVKREKEKLQGAWTVTELREADKKAPDEKAHSLRIEFKGEAIMITIKDNVVVKGTFAVDPDKSPATMNINFEKDGKAITIPAIYELKGDDLKVCHTHGESTARPSVIESSGNTVLITLKRKKS
jgi:uncharacterized protein (TIGR03067 family)